ncbi:hypothetical protein [Sulfurimonas sp. NWX79]|uniref:hypothetical protein n=1 Tax=Sulfurimonas sp. NWX79 TaxID=2925412 RepID=UPI0032046F88
MKLKVDGEIKIYTFEIYNGQDTKRVMQQLQKHIRSLQEGLPSVTLNEKKGSKVLLLFDSTSCMRAVMDRVKSESVFMNFKNLFLFNDTQTLKTQFDSWCSCESRYVKL